jgi:hypothetical protein
MNVKAEILMEHLTEEVEEIKQLLQQGADDAPPRR